MGDPPAGPPPVSPLNIGVFRLLQRGVNAVDEIFLGFFGENLSPLLKGSFLKIKFSRFFSINYVFYVLRYLLERLIN